MLGLHLKNLFRSSTTHTSFPNNYYEAKRLVSKLVLESKKIDYCVNNCMLFYDNDSGQTNASLLQCKFVRSLNLHNLSRTKAKKDKFH